MQNKTRRWSTFLDFCSSEESFLTEITYFVNRSMWPSLSAYPPLNNNKKRLAMMRSCLRLDFKSCSPDPATNSEIKNHNFHDIFWPIRRSFTSLVCLFVIVFWSKNNLIAKFVKIRSFGIGCWILWARWSLIYEFSQILRSDCFLTKKR